MEDSEAAALAPTEHAPKPEDLREIKNCPECGQRFGSDARFCPFDGTALDAARYDPSSDSLIGKLVDGRYEIEAVLGEGGMGTVYRVRHAALDRPFAMKVLRRDLARDSELAQRFTTEARATAAVRHPNIVSINDFGALEDGTPYFVMELLVGRTLSDVLRAGGPVPPAQAVGIIRQIASALEAAHTAGVIHRDLKPENVFLVGSTAGGPLGDVRIVDFGAARIVGTSRITKAGIVFGTPHFMSPEQAGGREVDHRTDIYSLGIIMYEMFTGRVPFEADSYMGVLTQHLYVRPQPPTQAYPALAPELGALEDITLRALEKRRDDRYASMRELLADMDSVARVGGDGGMSIAARLDRRTVSAAPEGVEALSLPMQGSLARWIAGGAVVGALIVFGAVFVLRARARPPAAAVHTAAGSASASSMPPSAPAIEPKHVLVSATPGTALVFQAGTLVGPTPIELTVDPSELPARYRVKEEGYLDQDLTIDSSSAEEARVVLRPLVKRAPPARVPVRPQPTPMDDVGDPFVRK